MTPKEKAIELRDKFRIFIGTSKGDEGETINNYLVGKKEAKLGAIILCDEIIRLLSMLPQSKSITIPYELQYWNRVKIQIENL